MNFFKSLFGGGGGKNPADEAMKYLDQIPGQTQPYYEPYINAGKGALNQLQGQYGQMLNNPGAMYDKFAKGYKESPGYQLRLKEALNAGNSAQAAGGMLGTPQHERTNMGLATDVASQDFENYLNHILGLHTEGLDTANKINTMGYGASTGYADSLANLLGTKAQYGFEGQKAKNAAGAGGLSDLLGLFTALGTAPMTGGGSLFGYGASKLTGGS
jgi:hypothetical protein